MKYLLEDWGVERFQDKVESYFGKKIQPLKPLPEFKYFDFLGWHEQGDGKWFVGISIQNGRIKDEGSLQLKTALKEIVQKFNLPIRLTPSQDVILYEIDGEQKAEIQTILKRCGIKGEDEIDPLVRYSMACPALPTCGLATTESERAIPSILDRIRALLNQVGLPEEHFIIRMTGCPNGCARPYLAELGFVGNGPNLYQVWLGAAPNQTRLAQVYIEKMNVDDLEKTLEPIFVYFKQSRLPEEGFGDFCDRVGLDAIRQYVVTYQPGGFVDGNGATDNGITDHGAADTDELIISSQSGKPTRVRRRITVQEPLYIRLLEAAASKGIPVSQMANEAIEEYLKQNQE
ncbi:hypothetical protein [Kovacikia minuta]|uniref:hypothetical protein n=1 Tax=Kovacikia minuta TaxID=2931930 RepID=UPI0036F3285F